MRTGTNEKIVISAVALGLLMTTMSFAFKMPVSWSGTALTFQFSLAADLLMTILHLGAATLFILSLSVYKKKLRLALAGIVLGIILTALGAIQLPFLDMYNLWTSPYVTYGFVIMPFLFSCIAFFAGSAIFGRLVGDRGPLTNGVFVPFLAIIMSGLSALLPHAPTPTPETSYDLTMALFTWTLFLSFCSAMIFLKISSRTGAHYRSTMRWLTIGMFCISACILISMLDILISPTSRSSLTTTLNVLVVVSGFVWLRAGYVFARTKEY